MERTKEHEVKAGVDLARVRAALGPVLSAHRVLLVDLEWLTERLGWTLRLTIEREAASHPPAPSDGAAPFGVTLADCAEVSRDVSAVLDVEDLIPQRYHLEVSSPGLDRPLRSAADFARFSGRTARVKLRRPAPDGQRVLRGTLEAPGGEGTQTIAVVVDGKRIEVPLADVAEANLVFELSPQPKKRLKGAPKAGADSGKRSPGGSPGGAER
jgi:ribosome maturation factor RimP